MAENKTIDQMTANDWRGLGKFTFNLNREQVVARMEKAEAHCDLLLAALEAVEWMRQEGIGNVCPWCEWDDFDGHAPDCQRQATITAVRGNRVMLKAARVTHPGRLIGKELDARAMPMPNDDIYWIVAGRDRITLGIAQDLAALFGTSAQLWLNLQANYDEAMDG